MNGMGNVLLSIIIPTYNGGKYLDENLSELLQQLKLTSPGEIEVIIANNASEDNTDDIVKRYIKDYPDLTYIKRDSNIGSMANFKESIAVSKGEFVFLLGDDDIVCPRFLEIITTLLKDNPSIGILHWNRIDYKMKTMACSLFNNKLELPYIKIYNDYSQFVKNHATMDSMSTVLFKKRVWDDGRSYVSEKHYGYLWYSQILNGAVGYSCCYSYYPLIIQRHPSQRKWMTKQPLYTSGLMNIYQDLDKRVPGVYEWIKSNYVMLTTENFINEMVIVAENKSFYKPYYSELTSHNGKIRNCILYSIIYLMPTFISKVLLTFIKVFVVLKRRLKR